MQFKFKMQSPLRQFKNCFFKKKNKNEFDALIFIH